jgi:rhodanese-related sulfurtransferase
MFYNSRNVFVDIRERNHYEYGHIVGAINIPADEIDNLSEDEIIKLKDKTHVIVYWNSGCCGVPA